MIRINQSYRTQRVTGQQRYAAEISKRLQASAAYVPLQPTGFWSHSALRVWVWVQLVLPLRARHDLVLSMTSRAPLWRRRHVLVVHDLFVLTHPEWFSRSYVWTHALLLRAQLRSAATVVAVSQPVAEELAGYYAGPVVVAPNAPSAVFGDTRAESSEQDDGSTSVLPALDLEPGQYFLAVGSKDPRKNLARLADAYGRLDEHQRKAHPLVVVGGGSAIYRNQSLTWPAGTVDAGYVDDDDLRDLYRHSLAVVFVSQAEGFGLPLVEAAAAGATRLVVSDIEVFHWICGDHAHYVDPYSVSDIASGLRAALTTPHQQEMDLDRFNWDTSAAVIDDACQRVGR